MVVRYQAGAPGAVVTPQQPPPPPAQSISFTQPGMSMLGAADPQVQQSRGMASPSMQYGSPGSQPMFMRGPSNRRASNDTSRSMQPVDTSVEGEWALGAQEQRPGLLSNLGLQAVRHGSLEAPGSLNIRASLAMDRDIAPKLQPLRFDAPVGASPPEHDDNQARLDEYVQRNLQRARHGSLDSVVRYTWDGMRCASHNCIWPSIMIRGTRSECAPQPSADDAETIALPGAGEDGPADNAPRERGRDHGQPVPGRPRRPRPVIPGPAAAPASQRLQQAKPNASCWQAIAHNGNGVEWR